MRTYSELISFPTFKQRFEYCKMKNKMGIETFGPERYLNQQFYNSTEWKHLRNKIILRDNACDLACLDYPVNRKIHIHHLNPVTVDDFKHENFDVILDPEFLVCVSIDTHNAIHYGTDACLKIPLVQRKAGDTAPWRVS